MGVTITPDNFTNFATSAIAGGNGGAGTSLINTDTTLLVTPGTGTMFPAAPFRLVISPNGLTSEIVTVTNVSTDTFTITRAQEGTTAQTWPLNTGVTHAITAANMANLWTAISNINLTNGGSVSGALSANTLTGTGEVDIGPAVSGIFGRLFVFSSSLTIRSPATGTANGLVLQSWNGASVVTPFSIGGQFNAALAWVDNSGNIDAPAFVSSQGTLALFSKQGGAANGAYCQIWNGAAGITPFSIGGQFNSALSWVDIAGNFHTSLPGQAGDSTHFRMDQVAGAGATTNTIFVSIGHTGGIDIFDLNANKSILFSNNLAQIGFVGGIGAIAGQNTAGTFGVPMIVAQSIDQAVAVNTNTNIATFTLPARNCLVRLSMAFGVGGGNTNNGTITAKFTGTNPASGAADMDFVDAGSDAIVGAATYAKGTWGRLQSITVELKASTAVTIQYQNGAAGTIADTVTGLIELLS